MKTKLPDNHNYFSYFPLVLTEHQRSVLIGTLLGDGSLDFQSSCERPRLQLGHCEQQLDYLLWKRAQFGTLFSEEAKPRRYVRNGGTWFQVKSRSHPALLPYFQLFYSRPENECSKHIYKKAITAEVLRGINDQALAIWWCDDGTVFNNKKLVFCLGGLASRDYQLVVDWFRNMDIVPTQWDYRKKAQRWTNSIRISFNELDTQKLLIRIYPYIPACMQFKLKDLKP